MNERQMMLARDFDWSDVVGWIASEKLWDVRCYWDGWRLWTRGGNIVDAPDWFTAGLPAHPLDGGVYIPGELTDRAATDAVNFGRFPANAKFAIYDAPEAAGNKIARLATVQLSNPAHFVLEHRIIESNLQLAQWVSAILARGGEGLMLTHPKSGYLRQRTAKMLKLKFVPQEFLCA